MPIKVEMKKQISKLHLIGLVGFRNLKKDKGLYVLAH